MAGRLRAIDSLYRSVIGIPALIALSAGWSWLPVSGSSLARLVIHELVAGLVSVYACFSLRQPRWRGYWLALRPVSRVWEAATRRTNAAKLAAKKTTHRPDARPAIYQ